MIIAMVQGHTRVCGKSQGYLGLPIRDEVVRYTLRGEERYAQQMLTAWTPTPDELARLAAGAPVLVAIMGYAVPPAELPVPSPMSVYVGEAPSGDAAVREDDPSSVI